MPNEPLKISRPYYSKTRFYDSLVCRVKKEKSPPRVPFYFNVTFEGRSVLIRDIDAIYFENPSSLEAQKHFNLILAARKGKGLAQRELVSKLEKDTAFYQRFALQLMNQADFPDFLIPSTTTKGYSREEASNKGYNLLRLVGWGLPVPSFCLINSRFFSENLNEAEKKAIIDGAVKVLENLTGKKFNNPNNPLLFSVRSGMRDSLPGLMPTYLNVGAAREILPALINLYGEEGAFDIRINHLKTLLLESDPVTYKPILDGWLNPYPTGERRKSILQAMEKIINNSGLSFPNDPRELLYSFVSGTERFFLENRDLINSFFDKPGGYPAMIFQEMTEGRLPNSFSAVFHTTDPIDGVGPRLILAEGAYGEEIMTGRAPTLSIDSASEIANRLPIFLSLQTGLLELADRTNKPLSFELTNENGMFAVLQMDQTALSGSAALHSVVNAYREGKINKTELLRSVRPFHLAQVFSSVVNISNAVEGVAVGVNILPVGDVCGRAYFSEDKARASRDNGQKTVLIKESFNPGDVEIMNEMQGLISLSLAAAHITELALRKGIPSLVGINQGGVAPALQEGKMVLPDGAEIKEGDFITISSEKQKVYKGEIPMVPSPFLLLFKKKGTDVVLTEAEKVLWGNFQFFAEAVKQVQLEDLLTANDLASAVNFMDFLGLDSYKVNNLIVRWFEANSDRFIEYFTESNIGQHKGRIRIYYPLNPAQKIKLIKGLLDRQPASGGTFIIGRLLRWEKLESGAKTRTTYDSIIYSRTFSREEQKRLLNEELEAKQYLVATGALMQEELDDNRFAFNLAVKRQVSDYSKLSPEQKTRLWELWEEGERTVISSILPSNLSGYSVDELGVFAAVYSQLVDPDHKTWKTCDMAIRAIEEGRRKKTEGTKETVTQEQKVPPGKKTTQSVVDEEKAEERPMKSPLRVRRGGKRSFPFYKFRRGRL